MPSRGRVLQFGLSQNWSISEGKNFKYSPGMLLKKGEDFFKVPRSENGLDIDLSASKSVVMVCGLFFLHASGNAF